MVRVQAVFLRRFNQALDHGAGLRATERIGKEPIFPPHHKWLNAALDTLFLYADNVPYAHDIFILIFIAICAGRRPQMRCSAAGLRSQRPPFRRAQRPPGDGSRQPLSHPLGCGFGSNENGEVLRCPFQNGVGRNLVIQDHCTPALWVTLRADERAELHLATFL